MSKCAYKFTWQPIQDGGDYCDTCHRPIGEWPDQPGQPEQHKLLAEDVETKYIFCSDCAGVPDFSAGVMEICNECGQSVALGDGRFVNRAPDLNTLEQRQDMGKPFPEGDWVCAGCDDCAEEVRNEGCRGIVGGAAP